HVAAVRLHSRFRHRKLLRRRILPVALPTVAIEHLATRRNAGEAWSQVTMEARPVFVANALPHEALVLLASGGVLPRRMLRLAAIATGQRKNHKHRGHEGTQRNQMKLSQPWMTVFHTAIALTNHPLP